MKNLFLFRALMSVALKLYGEVPATTLAINLAHLTITRTYLPTLQ